MHDDYWNLDLKSTFLFTFIKGWPLHLIFIVRFCLVMWNRVVLRMPKEMDVLKWQLRTFCEKVYILCIYHSIFDYTHSHIIHIHSRIQIYLLHLLKPDKNTFPSWNCMAGKTVYIDNKENDASGIDVINNCGFSNTANDQQIKKIHSRTATYTKRF